MISMSELEKIEQEIQTIIAYYPMSPFDGARERIERLQSIKFFMETLGRTRADVEARINVDPEFKYNDSYWEA